MARVKIFENYHYSGMSQELEPGRYVRDKLGLGDNTVSSVQVPPGWMVTLWDGAGCVGDSRILTASVEVLYNLGFNDKTSSIGVVCPASECGMAVLPSLGFPGKDAYLEMGPLDITTGGGFDGLTIEMWVCFGSAGDWARLVDIYQTEGRDNIMLGRHGTAPSLCLQVFKNGDSSYLIAADVIPNNQWIHVAVTLQPGGWGRMFVNGVEVAARQVHTPELRVHNTARVGHKGWGGGDAYFGGQLAELRLWSRCRTAEEIKRSMTTRLTGAEHGLLRYYRMDEAAGAVLRDLAGKCDATLYGAAVHALAGPVLRDPTANAMRFDGVYDYVRLPDLRADLSQGFTIEAWAYFEGTQAYGRIVDLGNGQALDNVLFARSGDSNTLYVHIFSGDRSGYAEAGDVLRERTWMHLAATLGEVRGDGTGLLSIYVDGALRGSNRVPAPGAVVRRSAYIGRSNWAADPLFCGRLAEVRLWTRCRTRDELLTTMTGRLDPAEPGLAACYPLDDLDGTRAQDTSPNALHGTLGSAFAWRQAGPAALVSAPAPAAALSFNGTDTHVEMPALTADLSRGLTIEVLAYITGVGSFARFVDLGNGPGDDSILFARSGVSDDVYVHVFRGAGASATSGFAGASAALTLATWTHFAATLTPQTAETGTLALYVNGELRASASVPMPRSVTRGRCYIGKSNWPDDPPFQGDLAEVRLWTVARSQAELRAALGRKLRGDEPGLCRYYPLDEAAGGEVLDRVTGGMAAIHGASQRATPTPASGAALAFDGSTTHIELPALADDLSQGFTIEAWVFMTRAKKFARIVDLGDGPGQYSILFARADTTDDLYLHIFRDDGAGPNGSAVAKGVLRLATWMHLAATLSPGTNDTGLLTLFVNGEARASNTVPMPRTRTRTRCYIGKSNWAGDELFAGRMAEVRLWNLARTPSELRGALGRRLTGTERGLCRYYPLDEVDGALALDRTLPPASRGANPAGQIRGSASRSALQIGAGLQPPNPPLTSTRALALDHGDAYAELPSLGFDYARGLTIEAWIRFDAGIRKQTLVTLGRGSTGDALSVTLLAMSEPQGVSYVLNAMEWRGGSLRSLAASIPGAAPQVWLHVAVTLDDHGAGALYVNGAPLPAPGWASWAGLFIRPTLGLLSRSYLGTDDWRLFPVEGPCFLGGLADVRIWSRVRSPAEIQLGKNLGVMQDDRSLAAWYRLDEASGSVARDASGAGRHAVLRRRRPGAEVPVPRLLPPPATVGSLAFNGTSDWVELPPVTADFTQGFTIETWAYITADGDYPTFLWLGNGIRDAWMRFGRDEALPDLVMAFVGRDDMSYAHAPGALRRDEWTHVAASLTDVAADGYGVLTLYVNGEARGSRRASTPRAAAERRLAYLGRGLINETRNGLFQGRLAELRIWTRGRSAEEIQGTMSARLRGDEPGLYAEYRLHDGEGELARDASRQARHGGLHGATWDSGAPLLETPASRTGVLRLDGAGFVALPGLAVLPRAAETPAGATAGLTLEAWVYCRAVAGAGRFIALGNTANDAPADTLYLGHQGPALVLGVQLGADAVQVATAPDALAANRWIHVAASVDRDGHVVLCRNGVPLALDRTTLPAPAAVARSLAYLGRSLDGALFSGRIAEARVWNAARTPLQILANHRQRLVAGASGLVRSYTLTGTQGTRAPDLAADRQDGAVQGPATWDAPRPLLASPEPVASPPVGGPDRALVFDGASTYVRLPEITLDLSAGFTLEAWIFVTAITSYARIFDLGNGPGQDSIIFTREALSENLYVHIFTDTDQDHVLAPDALRSHTWLHIAATLGAIGDDGRGLLTIHVDGQARASKRVPVPRSVTRGRCFLGKSNWPNDGLFQGRIAAARIWTRARTPDELRSTMSKRLLGDELGLAADYALNESADGTLRNASLRLDDAVLRGDRRFDGGPTLAAATPQPLLVPRVPGTLPTPTPPLGPPTGPVTSWTPPTPAPTNDAQIDLALATYVNQGIQLELLWTRVAVTFKGTLTVTPLERRVVLRGDFEFGRASKWLVPDAALTLDRGAAPMVYSLRFAPTFAPRDLVQVLGPPAPVTALLEPFLRVVTDSVVVIASDDGDDPELGDFSAGFNLYTQRVLSDLPGLRELHTLVPSLGLNTVPLILWIALRAAGDFRVAATVPLRAALLDTPPVKLVFDEFGVHLGAGARSSAFGVTLRFTLALLDTALVFRGGLTVEKGSTSTAVGLWAALDPAHHPDGRWDRPFGFPGLAIGGLGVQIKLLPIAPWIGIGARGDIRIGGNLLGGSIAINLDPANWDQVILAIESEEGLDLPALLGALVPLLGASARAFLSTIADIRLKDLELYFAPNGGSIAGKQYAAGVAIGGRLELWGWGARVFGSVSPTTGGTLRGAADRLLVAGAGLTLVRFSDATGDAGPQVAIDLNTTRQGLAYSGRLVLLGGLHDAYQELAVSGSQIQFTTGSVLGSLELLLDWRRGCTVLTARPRLVFSFEVVGINVNLGVSALLKNTVDSSGYQQELSFSLVIGASSLDLGPIAWSITLGDAASVLAAFESLFGDRVKRFFTDTLAAALREAVEWVKNTITDRVEEVVALFKAAGAPPAALARQIVDVFNIPPSQVISLLGTSLQEAAGILRDTFAMSAEETARVLSSAYGASASTIQTALRAAGYAASEISSAVDKLTSFLESGFRWLRGWF